MPDLSREEVIGLMNSPTWLKISEALKSQRAAFMERIAFGGTVDKGSVERTALNTVEATAEIRMYDEILKLDELLFGIREPQEEGEE